MSPIDQTTQRVLERLQTGWRPSREEIEQVVGSPVAVEEGSGASITDPGVLRRSHPSGPT